MQSSFLDAPVSEAQSFALETVKSWRSFRGYLDDARRMWVVSYCDSPRLLLQLFDEFELEALELVSGNVKDYRDRFTDEEADLVDRLERLKREERLTIYTCPTKTAHSKLYLLETDDGTYRCMTGSANLTRNSWGNHTNHLAVFETARGELSPKQGRGRGVPPCPFCRKACAPQRQQLRWTSVAHPSCVLRSFGGSTSAVRRRCAFCNLGALAPAFGIFGLD